VPLTDTQKQLFILAKMNQIDEANILASYSIPVSLQLRGPLQVNAMQKAIQRLIERHEMLRTTIMSIEEQCILPSLKIEVPLIEFEHLTVSERDTVLAEWLKQESQKPFDLSKGPLFRVYIFKLTEELHLLTLITQHLIADGLSMDILLQELAALYLAECQRIACQLTTPLQFFEYTQGGQIEKATTHDSYLKQVFAEKAPILTLPTDYSRPPINHCQGNRETIRLETNLGYNLKRVSREHKCSLFMTLMAGYGIFLHGLTGKDDLVIGIPTGGRSMKGGERVIGNLRHLLPVRVRLTDNSTFSEYLAKLKTVLLTAYEHQDYSFAKAFNQLLVQGEPNSPPLVATTFNLDRFIMPQLFQLVVEDFFALPISFMPFDLSLNIIEVDDELICDFEYNVELFKATTIQGWLASFQTLLENIVANPSEQVTHLMTSTSTYRLG
jgi:NRPS condensation-like uncharacterized protein